MATGKRATLGRYSSPVHDECERLMRAHKREWVGRFMRSSLEPKQAAERVWDVCGPRLAGVCATDEDAEVTSPATPVPKSECDSCVAAAALFANEAAHAAPHRLSSERTVVEEVLEPACVMSMLAYPKGDRLRETCEDLLLDHAGAIARQLLALQAAGVAPHTRADGLAAWLCAERTDECGSVGDARASRYAPGIGGYVDAGGPEAAPAARDEL